jgi:hypothetical protein
LDWFAASFEFRSPGISVAKAGLLLLVCGAAEAAPFQNSFFSNSLDVLGPEGPLFHVIPNLYAV